MSGYTVTITPSGGQPGPRTTITVDTANGAPRVSELIVEADGAGLSVAELPAIDLAGLVAALSPPAIPAAVQAPAVSASAGAATRKVARGTGRPAKAVPKSVTAKNVTRGRRRVAAADEAPATTTATSKRKYRRMPEQADVVAAWEATQSATEVARHFGVPRHTATGWLRRLRQTGVIDPTS